MTCCGSGYEQKDDKFGHALVFKEVKSLTQGKCQHCEAFPIYLVVPEDKKEDGDYVLKARLSDESFKGEIKERYEDFIRFLKSN